MPVSPAPAVSRARNTFGDDTFVCIDHSLPLSAAYSAFGWSEQDAGGEALSPQRDVLSEDGNGDSAAGGSGNRDGILPDGADGDRSQMRNPSGSESRAEDAENDDAAAPAASHGALVVNTAEAGQTLTPMPSFVPPDTPTGGTGASPPGVIDAGIALPNPPPPPGEAVPLAGAIVVDGSGGDDTLVVTATGVDSGTYSLNGGPAIAFSGVSSITFNGGAGNDQMTVINPDGGLFAPAGGVSVNGGTQGGDPGDGLEIVGGEMDTATYTTDAHHADGKDGSIVLAKGGVTATYRYTGLEPLANTGSTANVIFNLPTVADNAFLEDDGTAGNNRSQLRSASGTFETTVFTNPTGSLTINSGSGDTVTVNLVDSLTSANLTIGSLTNSALNPDIINLGSVVTDGRVTLAATGAIAEANSDLSADVFASQLDLSAGSGIGTADTIETAVGNLEAQTGTGGIFLANTAANLFIGGQFGVPELTGLKVATSGDINIVNAGSINLADTDGGQTVLGGSTSGNVTLNASGASSDFLSGSFVPAIWAPAGSVTVQAGQDISFFTPGIGLDFNNDVRADRSVVLLANRNLSINGDADIVSDAFGHDTQGGVGLHAGLAGPGNPGSITISSVGSSGANDGVSVGAVGRGGVNIRTGFGGANVFTNQKTVFSGAGNITIQSDSEDFQPGSTLSANNGTVSLGITTAPVNADLGSTAAGFNFSQAELNTISAKVLSINPSGNINISQSITLDPALVPTLELEASFSGAGSGGRITDGVAGEQDLLNVANLRLRAVGSIGTTADDLDVHTQSLAFLNDNFFNLSDPVINVSNSGPLTVGVIPGFTASQNSATDTTITTSGPLTVTGNVKSTGQLVLKTIDSAAAGENVTISPGVTAEAGGTLFVYAGDNIDLQAGSTVKSPGLVSLVADANNADPGVGATINVRGTLAVPQTGVGGGSDADIFNVTPSVTSEIYVGGLDPTVSPGDTLNVTTTGTSNPTLQLTLAGGDNKYGQYTFGDRKLVNFTDIETLNVLNGPLTVNGSELNDSLVLNPTSAGNGSFTYTGPLSSIGTLAEDSPIPISAFGVPNTASYGQVITADALHAKLSSFSFEMNLPSTVAMRGEVYAWDGTKATGPALFESSPVSTSGSGNFELITFNAGGVALTPGQKYVLFASTSRDQAGHSGTGSWQYFNGDFYSGGSFVFLNNGGAPSQWTTSTWTQDSTKDLAFQARFDLPATVGFGGLTSLGFNGQDGNDSFAGNPSEQLVNVVALTGGNGKDKLVGNGLANNLSGGEGDDTLDGGGGADTMTGGNGDDWYFVDNAGDVIIEPVGQGAFDRAFASVSYTLTAGASIELFSTTNHTGTTTINLTGNELPDNLYGNDGDNILNGMAGADFMTGRAGNDWYYVDNVGDIVSEPANQGAFDRVFASVSYTLPAGAEIEVFSTDNHAGTEAINLTGNELPNLIYGNAGVNTLDGKGGADTMVGGTGSDFYFVDNPGDVVVEGASEGAADRIFTSVDYTLGAGVYVEIFATTDNLGTAPLKLTGNELVNTIFGNAGDNILDGKGGADSMGGFGGNDFYYVDNGSDFVFESAAGGTNDIVQTTVDYTLPAAQEIDVLQVDAGGTAPINLYGNEFSNVVKGSAGSNAMKGGLGNDFLVGRAGGDAFIFDTVPSSSTNVDTVYDFAHAEGDSIVLRGSIFAGPALGTLAAGNFRVGAAAADGNDYIIYNSATGALYYDQDGTGATPQVQFASMFGTPTLAAGDFMVV